MRSSICYAVIPVLVLTWLTCRFCSGSATLNGIWFDFLQVLKLKFSNNAFYRAVQSLQMTVCCTAWKYHVAIRLRWKHFEPARATSWLIWASWQWRLTLPYDTNSMLIDACSGGTRVRSSLASDEPPPLRNPTHSQTYRTSAFVAIVCRLPRISKMNGANLPLIWSRKG